MNEFLFGVLVSLSAVSTLLFARSWVRTRDRLFIAFATAFALLGLNWFLLVALSVPDEAKHLLYLVRLAAFVVLIVGIVDKNRAAR